MKDETQENVSDTTYYDVLGLHPAASDEEISAAYREQTKEYHPDKSDHSKATDLFADINQAREALLNGEHGTDSPKPEQVLNYEWQDGTPLHRSGEQSTHGDDEVDTDDWITDEDDDVEGPDPDPDPDDVVIGDDEPGRQEPTAYRVGRVVVTPAPENEPNAYEYSDLRRGQTPWILRYTFDLAFWIVYLMVIFPYQYILRALRWRFWDNISVGLKTRLLMAGAKRNVQKLPYLTTGDRRRLYLRASRLYTPAQLFPFLPGTAPEPEDSSVESPPYPQNWDQIRRQIYERDGYRCVNCGRGGGPNGKAELHVDHVLPRSRGGPDVAANMRTLCRSCHGARHARIFEQ